MARAYSPQAIKIRRPSGQGTRLTREARRRAEPRRSAPLGLLPHEPTFPLLLGGFLGGLSPCSCLHKACKLRRWQRRVDVPERALVLDLSCGEDEPAHGRAVERGGKADP